MGELSSSLRTGESARGLGQLRTLADLGAQSTAAPLILVVIGTILRAKATRQGPPEQKYRGAAAPRETRDPPPPGSVACGLASAADLRNARSLRGRV